MPTPEINVRLTADGVQDVINAFRRVQAEGKKTAERVSLLGEAGKQMKELLPVVSIGLFIEKVVELGKDSLNTAVQMGRLGETIGANVGTLSVFAQMAHDVQVNQDAMATGLTRLARNQQDASDGLSTAKRAFANLGVSMDDVRKKDPTALFIEMSKKLQEIPPGAERAALAQQLLGRAGAQLVPLMNKIGEAGNFEQAEAKAKKLGVYLSEDLVKSAEQAQEAMNDLHDTAKGFANQFLTGFAPAMAGALDDFTGKISGSGTDSIRQFGSGVGNVVRGIVDVFVVAGKTIGTIFFSVFDGIKTEGTTIINALMAAAKGNFSGAWSTLTSGTSDLVSRQATIWKSYGSDIADLYKSHPSAESKRPHRDPTGAGGVGDSAAADKALKERQKLIGAQATFEATLADSELQTQKMRDAKAQAEDKDNYEKGLLSLNAYYDARAQRIDAESDAELAIIKSKLQSQIAAAAELMGKSTGYISDLMQQGPKAIEAAAGANTEALGMLQKIAQTKAQMDQAEIQRQTQLGDNERERAQAEQETNARILSDRQRLYQLEGDTASARQLALERELQETDQLLKRLGVADAQRNEILSRVRTNAQAQTKVDILSQRGGNAFTSLNRDISAIQSKAQNGTISELDAEAQIYKLEKQRLPTLSQIAQSMQDVVDQNSLLLLSLEPNTAEYKAQEQVVENLQKQVDQYTEQVDQLGASLQRTTSISVQLSNMMSTQGVTAAVDFFDAIGTGTKFAGEAFADMGKQFEQMIVHMIDQMIMYYAMMAIVGWIAPGSSLYTSLKASGPFGSLPGHASGGFTGNAPTNKVAGLVHGKEFVFNAAATQRWGLPLLQAMNAGTVGFIASSSTYSSLGGISGEMAGGDNGTLVEVNIQNGSGAPVSQSQRTGPGGQSILDVVIGQVASDIAGGGKVAQSIQSTYGVARKGTLRG